jgi:peptidoglycan-associated lipoprotein
MTLKLTGHLMERLGLAALATVLVMALAACGSNVKLEEPPVEDKRGTVVNPSGSATATSTAATLPQASTATVGQSSVTPVTTDSNAANLAGPANISKVIYFDYDSFAIRAEAQTAIEAHARFLTANRARKVSLEGHTDERGGREYNLALGQKRGEAVARALKLLGVNDDQMEAVSFGKEKPAVAGVDEATWAQNRRVEMRYR